MLLHAYILSLSFRLTNKSMLQDGSMEDPKLWRSDDEEDFEEDEEVECTETNDLPSEAPPKPGKVREVGVIQHRTGTQLFHIHLQASHMDMTWTLALYQEQCVHICCSNEMYMDIVIFKQNARSRICMDGLQCQPVQ